MLVLTRKKDEQIRIGDHIIITVIRVKGKAVRLGIQAPRTEPVLRGELEFREENAGDVVEDLASAVTICSAACTPASTLPQRSSKRPLRDFLVGGPRTAVAGRAGSMD